ncbi:MAG: peptidase [Nitrosopumilus sp.]
MLFFNHAISVVGSIFLVFSIVSSTAYSYESEWENEQTSSNSGTVSIPEDEFISFFDSNGIFTVVGNVKNSENFPILPIVLINIQDDDRTVSKSFEHVAIPQGKELPFKVRFPEVTGKNPILEKPEISYVPTKYVSSEIQVIYDETLVQHTDGHLSGKIINYGEVPVYNIKVFAIIHGFEEVLDMGQNIDMIEKLEPGETRDFVMYPDPSIKSEISYYSCFAVTDSFVRPVYSERNGERFYFRYDSGSWYTAPQFNEKGTDLTMRTQNSFPLETYTNFEFPLFSEDEKFSVFVNGELKENIQSIDEMQNWHVAFNVEPYESGEIRITGFKEGYDPGDAVLIPDWIKTRAAWWADSKLEDEVFLKGIEFMIKEKIITIESKTENGTKTAEKTIPEWFRNNAMWWSQDNIENETFAKGLEYLINYGIIKT